LSNTSAVFEYGPGGVWQLILKVMVNDIDPDAGITTLLYSINPGNTTTGKNVLGTVSKYKKLGGYISFIVTVRGSVVLFST
jgi:hypothetical protein